MSNIEPYKFIYLYSETDIKWTLNKKRITKLVNDLDNEEIALAKRYGFDIKGRQSEVHIPKNGLFLYVMIEQKIVGIMGIRFFDEDGRKSCGINNFYVDPKYRKQGLGTKLLKEAKILAKSKLCEDMYLNVLIGNKAVKLYQDNDFVIMSQNMKCKL